MQFQINSLAESFTEEVAKFEELMPQEADAIEDLRTYRTTEWQKIIRRYLRITTEQLPRLRVEADTPEKMEHLRLL